MAIAIAGYLVSFYIGILDTLYFLHFRDTKILDTLYFMHFWYTKLGLHEYNIVLVGNPINSETKPIYIRVLHNLSVSFA